MSIWWILIPANIPIYFLLGWKVFKSWAQFRECIKFWLKPDLFSALDGEAAENLLAELRLAWWLLLCAGAVFLEYLFIEALQT